MNNTHWYKSTSPYRTNHYCPVSQATPLWQVRLFTFQVRCQDIQPHTNIHNLQWLGRTMWHVFEFRCVSFIVVGKKTLLPTLKSIAANNPKPAPESLEGLISTPLWRIVSDNKLRVLTLRLQIENIACWQKVTWQTADNHLFPKHKLQGRKTY
jgi:hypothetical protein